ncbi:unnamed protein product [Angiostrongylus costaricensis]|uniref:Ras-associating domain-containing protein n=1 Tax=Angiostrongylus costaricensis TaxID=334426 RepID=A0A0R3Q1C8_ANGCS|nr:unnamed protein product [Angiostrongylus costaricensis]
MADDSVTSPSSDSLIECCYESNMNHCYSSHGNYIRVLSLTAKENGSEEDRVALSKNLTKVNLRKQFEQKVGPCKMKVLVMPMVVGWLCNVMPYKMLII